jgi:7-cyano-7-deazaguanine reductase
MIQTFKNPAASGTYNIEFTCPELTFLCPKTGQPDFGSISIDYIPDQKCIELKSLKLYLWSYRDKGIGYEKLSNQIYRDLYEAAFPFKMSIEYKFNVRGGIGTKIVVARYFPKP